ncbi:MAG: hypothetical protein WBO44_12710 [Saprospiraceae bacterium]
MKYTYLTLIISGLTYISCTNEHITYNLNDLKKYLYRTDSFYCTSVKCINNYFKVEWKGNSHFYFDSINKYYYIVNNTYSDTTNWRNLDNSNNLKESIIFKLKDLSIGNQKLYSFNNNNASYKSIYLSMVGDGDVIDAVWNLDSKFNNFITITKVDTNLKVIHGVFDCNFIIDHKSNHANHFFNISFTDSKFIANFRQ